MKRAIAICLLVASSTFGQAYFEGAMSCTAAEYPTPCGTLGGDENISRNAPATGDFAMADVSNNNFFPTQGAQYGRVNAGGNGPAVANEMYIPIPGGATTVSFQWEFYNGEGGPQGTFNDGMSIEILAGCAGASLGVLAAASTLDPLGSGFDGGVACFATFGAEIAPDGPQAVLGAAIPAGGTVIRVACWNLGDTAVDSAVVLDCLDFNGNGGNCVPPPPSCVLLFSSPLGPGSLLIDNTQCAASALLDYQIAVAFAPGAFPNGWWFGVDIPFLQLIGQHAPVFQNILWGTLDGAGASSFGPVAGLPSGLQLWANTVEFAPGFGTVLGARASVTYTIP